MNSEKVNVGEILPQICHHITVVVRSAVKEAMEHSSTEKTSKESNLNEDFLSAEQTASFLKIKLNTVYSKAANGDLSFFRSGKRKLLFSKKELESYVAKRRVKSNDEIEAEVENQLKKKK